MTTIINIDDFGAVPDGVTDNTAAFLAAMAALPNGCGTIQFGIGWYAMSSNWLFEPASGRTFISNIHLRGMGGHHTDLATRIRFTHANTAQAAITLKSAVQFTFEHIDFVAGAETIALLKIQAAGPDPAYCSFNIAFRHCKLSSKFATKATAWINNSSNISFEHCFFLNSTNAVQVGSNVVDAENEGTFGGGTADQVTLTNCFFAADIVNYRCRALSFRSCIFDRHANIGGRGVRIFAAGDQLVRALRIEDSWAGYGDNTGAFLTLGAQGFNLTMTNNYVATYAKAVVLDGVGNAFIRNNEFALNTSGAVGIEVSNPAFHGDDLQVNDWRGMHASAVHIQDIRV